MDHAIYTAMGAASQTLNQQAVTASNGERLYAGFRAQLNALRAVPVEGLSLPTRTLVTASTPGADMTPGRWITPPARWTLLCSRTAGWPCKRQTAAKAIPATVISGQCHRPVDDSGAPGNG